MSGGRHKTADPYLESQHSSYKQTGRHTAHAVDDDQEVSLHVCNVESLGLQRIPAPDRINPRVEPCGQTMCRRNDGIQTLLVSVQFPVFP